MLTIKNIPLDDPRTWELFKTGKVLGVFQLETPLGRQFCKRLKPENMEHVAALTAILRPGTMQAFADDGKSMTQKYIDRKNKEEEVTYLNECLKPIVQDTYGILIYQETAIRLVAELADFSLVEADRLRKACGKKDTQEMSDIMALFRQKAIAKGLLKPDEVDKIATWITASQRFAFNKSHSNGYGVQSIQTAYLKAAYTVEFFCAWLTKSPKTDVKALVTDARSFGIAIKPPSIANIHEGFTIIDDHTIEFGFGSVQGCGAAQLEKIRDAIAKIEKVTKKKIGELTWLEFLVYGFYVVGKMFDIQIDKSVKESDYKTLSKSVIENLIKCGALDCFKVPRNRMLHELRQYKSLSPGEKKTLTDNIGKFKSLLDAIIWLRDGEKTRLDNLRDKDPEKGSSVEKRYMTLRSLASLLEKPPVRVTDSADDIVIYERELLNVAISANKLDKYYSDQADTTIKEYADGKNKGTVCIKCEISRLHPYECKTGDEMAFISIIDETGENDDCIMFTKEFADMKQKDLDYEGAQVLVWGERDWKKGSLIIKRVESLV
jgi:DNA polymerase III alpha subunit